MKQFPKALEAVTERCAIGHIKYADIDQDYQGFTMFPEDEYQNAIMRHLMELGEPDETELDHLKALAWNVLALLEIKLRNLK